MSLWPTANSKVLRPIPFSVSHNPSEPLIHIERQSRQLQSELQELLDSQSRILTVREPLVSPPNTSSTRSSTPTTSHTVGLKQSMPIPVRQPRKKAPTLRNVRQGILRSIHHLLCLKEEERDIVNSEIYARKDALDRVKTFMDKRAGLEKYISRIRAGNQQKHVGMLSNELRGLEEEIKEVESRLAELKARRRHMMDEITQLQNSVDAKLSSYEGALSLVKKDSEQFLKMPPIPPLYSNLVPTPFFSLNPGRRTLEMAEEHWSQELSSLEKRSLTTDHEIEALEEGGRIWNETVTLVTETEATLRNTLNQLRREGGTFEPAEKTLAERTEPSEIQKALTAALQKLDKYLQLAEEKKWSLLICSIGAEREAFKEARIRISNMFGHPQQALEDEREGTMVGEVPDDLLTSPTLSGKGSLSPDVHQPPEPEPGLEPELGPAQKEEPEQPVDTTDGVSACPATPPASCGKSDDDDEPDPTWLLSP
ncbi:Atg28p [Nannizzia gypsea CBS 118893]|uniref:Atg28p n=1 Tax=Arthroderma gypseum (strain ATCC MYA-4604 / CBS 118893) TaxID=535722 RepID=E4V5N2_ARTGP|nr:Atg28p [Nannizzia gypsea CBS 118893]EFR05407.1 Atg28p [Nannizzia gypsea CBS 118893]